MLKPGDTFERYTIEAILGQGGMGCVYRALDGRLGRRVALKVILDGAAGAETRARLLREARAAAALDHPNAIAIFDVGELEGAPYIVMELVSGQTLRGSNDGAKAPVSIRIGWLAGVARALAAAHRRGLVHRDIKPENVMVRDDGVVKVLDFGIARRTGGAADPHAATQAPALTTLTVEGTRMGTPLYMAPEQIRGDTLDGRADQFAWGVVAYELLTGRLPWRGANDALAVVASILTDEVDGAALDAASISSEVKGVVLRALAKRPEDRFATMDDVVLALEAIAKGEAPPGPGPLKAQAPPPPPKVLGATAAQAYSTADVREVLARAVERQASKGSDSKLGFDDLLTVAREVGVDEETLREASRAIRAREDAPPSEGDSTANRDAWIRRRRRAFYRHLGVYLIVNTALILFGALVNEVMWLALPALFWGIGVAIHGLMALSSNDDDWAERQRRMKWWLERRGRRDEARFSRKADRSASIPRKKGALPPRIEVPPEPAAAKVRVAEDLDSDRAEEEDIALTEQGEVKRRRR